MLWKSVKIFALADLFLFIFVLFTSHNSNTKINKSVDGMLGIQTRRCWIVSADRSTWLWQPSSENVLLKTLVETKQSFGCHLFHRSSEQLLPRPTWMAQISQFKVSKQKCAQTRPFKLLFVFFVFLTPIKASSRAELLFEWHCLLCNNHTTYIPTYLPT